MRNNPYQTSFIVLDYFRTHPGFQAASYTVATWARKRWPLMTNKMAYSALHRLEKTGKLERVGESCDFRLPREGR